MITREHLSASQLRSMHRIMFPNMLDHALDGKSMWMALYDDEMRLTEPVECRMEVEERRDFLKVVAGEERQTLIVPKVEEPRSWWRKIFYDPETKSYYCLNVGWSFDKYGAPYHQTKPDSYSVPFKGGEEIVAGDFKAVLDYGAR